MACSHPCGVNHPHPSSVSRATPITAGTKTALMRSTVCWMGAFRACACSTNRTMRDKADSAPSAVTRTRISPSPLSVPPVTACPTSRAMGRLSPVIADSSMWLRPSVMRPSTGTRWPGRTITTSPTRKALSARSIGCPSTITNADSGRRARRASSAAKVLRLARASSHLPSITKVITTADPSKYRWWGAGATAWRSDQGAHSQRLSP